tara:strand:- start:286 stop:567 length:282 start_codon:yes stop_codon:yes gene_type:complete
MSKRLDNLAIIFFNNPVWLFILKLLFIGISAFNVAAGMDLTNKDRGGRCGVSPSDAVLIEGGIQCVFSFLERGFGRLLWGAVTKGKVGCYVSR